MSYYGRLFKAMLWSHTRNIEVGVFPNVVQFSIPLYNDGATAKVLSAVVENSTLKLIVKREPEAPNPLIESEKTDQRQQLI
jgi:hypothetical protein